MIYGDLLSQKNLNIRICNIINRFLAGIYNGELLRFYSKSFAFFINQLENEQKVDLRVRKALEIQIILRILRGGRLRLSGGEAAAAPPPDTPAKPKTKPT